MRLGWDSKALEKQAYNMRVSMMDTIFKAKSGHQGGSLSALDIITTLYFNELNVDTERPDWEDRDRFVLSKGHASVGYYTVLGHRGFFPIEEMKTYSMINSRLQGHPDMCKTPGVDYTSGSLAQGFSAAIGIAMGGKLRKKDFRVYAMVGDGELNEGQIWEGILFAAKYKLDNFIAIIDRNGLQCSDNTENALPLEPLAAKWCDFGWEVLEIDGHDFQAILDAIAKAKTIKGKPVVIIASTIKGKGVSFMENSVAWHAQIFNENTYKAAKNELLQKGDRYND